MQGFAEVEHTAEWAFRARCADLQQLFSSVARPTFYLQAPKQLLAARALDGGVARLQPGAVTKG